MRSNILFSLAFLDILPANPEIPAKNISHAQGASYLGVVLEHVGILEWNGKQRGIRWRIMRPVLHSDELIRTIKAKMD